MNMYLFLDSWFSIHLYVYFCASNKLFQLLLFYVSWLSDRKLSLPCSEIFWLFLAICISFYILEPV